MCLNQSMRGATAREIVLMLRLLMLLCCVWGCCSQVVNLVQGEVRGLLVPRRVPESSVGVFLGIPYALAPLGRLRFRAPKAHMGWEGTYFATRHRPPCAQPSGSDRVRHVMSENCLFLNVYSPITKSKSNLMPVVVFFEGQLFTLGNPSDVPAEDLAGDQRVVVVTVHYRLNAFGFLKVSNHSTLNSNVGLWDQKLALQWVQNNIVQADPEQVTEEFGSLLRCPLSDANFVQCLQSVSTNEIVSAVDRMMKSGDLTSLFLPTFDSHFLSDSPVSLMANGFDSVPILTGVVGHEGVVMAYFMGPKHLQSAIEEPNAFIEDQLLTQALPSTSRWSTSRRALTRVVRREYGNREGKEKALLATLDMLSDVHFIAPLYKFLELTNASGQEVWTYWNSFPSLDMFGNSLRSTSLAPHGSDLLYLFGPAMHNRFFSSPFNDVNQEVMAVRLKALIGNFVRNQKTMPRTNLTHVIDPVKEEVVAIDNIEHAGNFWYNFMLNLAQDKDDDEYVDKCSSLSQLKSTNSTTLLLLVSSGSLFCFVFIILVVILLLVLVQRRRQRQKSEGSQAFRSRDVYVVDTNTTAANNAHQQRFRDAVL